MSKRSQQLDTVFLHGQRLHQAGRLAEAESVYRHILSAAPRHPGALHGLGTIALQHGDAQAADRLLLQAISLKPAAEFRLTHAAALTALGRSHEAATLAHTILRSRPQDARVWQVLGHALSDSSQPEPAIDAYRQALALQPGLPDIQNNLGTALRQAGRLEDAETVLSAAPPDPFALANLSSVQKERGRFQQAEVTLQQALRLAPGDPVLRYNQALLLLLLDRPTEAWDGWEQRFAAGAVPARSFIQPQWFGESRSAPLGDRTLLVHAEQGLGDTIQFCRWLPVLDGRVVFETPPRLQRLLSSNPGMPPMVAADGPLPSFDAVAPLLSLPARIQLQPAPVPYLFADAAKVAAWRSRIGTAGLRIGIAWQGYAGRYEDKGRSFALANFGPLARLPGIRLISLQKGEGEDQIAGIPFPVERLEGLDLGPDAFIDTAAAMHALDLIITSDTSIAHLAGALGRPVWVALRRVPDWRWLLDRPDSPWYPTMRLFRQTRHDDWADVFQAIADAVAALPRT